LSSRTGGLEPASCSAASTRCAPAPRPGARRASVISNTLVGPERITSSSSPMPARPGSRISGREVEEAAMRRCIDLQLRYPSGGQVPFHSSRWSGSILDDAYERCGEVTSEFAKTFYLGTQLMTPKQAKAIWAIYVWCRRTDELVDGPQASRITPQVRGTARRCGARVGGAARWRGEAGRAQCAGARAGGGGGGSYHRPQAPSCAVPDPSNSGGPCRRWTAGRSAWRPFSMAARTTTWMQH
jgi:hypothetical protein